MFCTSNSSSSAQKQCLVPGLQAQFNQVLQTQIMWSTHWNISTENQSTRGERGGRGRGGGGGKSSWQINAEFSTHNRSVNRGFNRKTNAASLKNTTITHNPSLLRVNADRKLVHSILNTTMSSSKGAYSIEGSVSTASISVLPSNLPPWQIISLILLIDSFYFVIFVHFYFLFVLHCHLCCSVHRYNPTSSDIQLLPMFNWWKKRERSLIWFQSVKNYCHHNNTVCWKIAVRDGL